MGNGNWINGEGTCSGSAISSTYRDRSEASNRDRDRWAGASIPSDKACQVAKLRNTMLN